MSTRTHERWLPIHASHAYAGGVAGVCADMLLHSVDTLKTRSQNSNNRSPFTYWTILRNEGVRGLYSGAQPAFLGSLFGTSLFFVIYDWGKRSMIANSVPPSVAHFSSALVADFACLPLYVPSELLKTRLQLQGRFNNSFSASPYNYRSLYAAVRTILKTEGAGALYYGFRATLCRDLPFSALQFVFYEKEREFAIHQAGSETIGVPVELGIGLSAGGLAGILTNPLDVVKTIVQTQRRSPPPPQSAISPNSFANQLGQTATPSTSGPLRRPAPLHIPTSSVARALRIIYETEGIRGLFRGWVPRGLWCGTQSSIMFAIYQSILTWLSEHHVASS